MTLNVTVLCENKVQLPLVFIWHIIKIRLYRMICAEVPVPIGVLGTQVVVLDSSDFAYLLLKYFFILFRHHLYLLINLLYMSWYYQFKYLYSLLVTATLVLAITRLTSTSCSRKIR